MLGAGVFSSLRVQSLEKRFDNDNALVAYRELAPAGQGTCTLASAGYEAPPGGSAASASTVRSTCSEARRFAALQYAFYGAGAAFTAAGVYFAFIAPPQGASTARTAWRLTPDFGSKHANLSLRATF